MGDGAVVVAPSLTAPLIRSSVLPGPCGKKKGKIVYRKNDIIVSASKRHIYNDKRDIPIQRKEIIPITGTISLTDSRCG